MSHENQEDILRQQKAQIDQIIDTLILNPRCEEELFKSLSDQLFDALVPYAEELRRKLNQMKQEKKIFGDMADAYERSIDEMCSRHEALIILLGEFRERQGISSILLI